MFYAQYHPRNFSNEFEVCAFEVRADRDQFVSACPRSTYSEYYSAYVTPNENERAYAITAAEARKLLSADLRDGYTADQRCLGRRITLTEYFGEQVVTAGSVDERGFYPQG